MYFLQTCQRRDSDGYTCHDDDFAVFMENKDRILEELKQGKVSSYNMAYVRDVKIKVNPETVPYIESRYVIR